MFKDRKGISPLVATVLLIAFSVALGAVVMSWGETYIEEKAQFVSGQSEVGGPCDAAAVAIIIVKDQLQLCTRGSNIDMFIENGDQAIKGLKSRVLGADGVSLTENVLKQPLPAGESLKVTFQFKPVGQITQIKLTPVMDVNGQDQFCTQSETIIEDIRTC